MLPLTRSRPRARFFGVSGPSFALDFVNGTNALDPRITFTRASSATYFDSAGVLQSATTNVPRFDYNPSTLAARGLLIEEQRTNLLTYSEDLTNAAWTKSDTTISADSITSPDGLVTADKVVESATTAAHNVQYPNVTTSTTTTSTVSFFAKAAERTVISVRYGVQSTANRGQGNVDLTNGTVAGVTNVGTATGTTITAAPVNNGWYRVVISVNPNDAVSTQMRLLVYLSNQAVSGANGPTYTGDGTSGLYIWGAQLEAGSFPTSYIPTTTTALTRAADVASVNTLSPWYNASEGTIYAEFGLYAFTAGQSYRFVFSDGTTSNQIRSRLAPSGTTQARHEVVNSGAATTLGSPATINLALSKEAFAYATNDYAGVVNGGTPSISSTVTVPSVNALQLGAAVGGASGILNGYLRRITYYPRRLSNAEIQAITA